MKIIQNDVEIVRDMLKPHIARNMAGLGRSFTADDLVDRINALPDTSQEKALLIHYWGRMCLALSQGNDEAVAGWLVALALATHTASFLLEKAATGIKFTKGRKPNTGGPVRKRIAAELKKNRKLKPREVWARIEAKHPKAWDVEGETQIWVDGRRPMGYKRFSEVCAEEKKKLQA